MKEKGIEGMKQKRAKSKSWGPSCKNSIVDSDHELKIEMFGGQIE